ncbi:MAG: hypothetical protein ACI8QC_000724 [Planctomycetota bacterium]
MEIGELKDSISRLQANLTELIARADREEAEVRSPDTTRRGKERAAFSTDIAAMQIFDVIHARGVDLSESGFGCATDMPLRFLFQFDEGGHQREKDCDLVWARTDPDGTFRMGFRFRKDCEAA